MSTPQQPLPEDRPDVVVLVPTINNAADLRRCLEAISLQSYGPFRTVVVDGRSTDETPALTAHFGAVYFADDASTRADALNNALRAIDCEVVVFTDDDCFPPPQWLDRLLRHFHRPEVAGVGGPNMAPPDQSFWGRVVDVAFASRGMTHGTRYGRAGGRLTEIDHNSGCNAAYRKTVLDEAGGFPDGSIGCEDVVLDHRITRRGHRLWFDPEAATYHRRRDRPRPLARQMRSYGRGHAHVNGRHPEISHPAYKLPALAVVGAFGVVAAAAAAALARAAGGVSATADAVAVAVMTAPLWALGLYALAGIGAAAMGSSRYRSLGTVLAAPLALGICHLYFGLGYLQGARELARGEVEEDREIGLGKKARGR